MEDFIAHGYYTVSNAGGYEVQLSRDGQSARLRDGDTITEWMDIEWVINEDDPDITDPVLDPDGYNIPFDQVMRIN